MNSGNQDIVFQCLDFVARDRWARSTDGATSADESDNGYKPYRKNKPREAELQYQILAYGLTSDGQSICAEITNFRPYFYIGIPEKYQTSRAFRDALRYFVMSRFPKPVAKQIYMTEVQKKVLYDFNNNQEIAVFHIDAPSKTVWSKLKDIFLDKDCYPRPITTKELGIVGDETLRLKIYEANIDPLLRFFHMSKLSPASWARLSDWEPNENEIAKTDLNVIIDANSIEPDEKLASAAFRTVSWDIECTSSHGDFPLAQKSYRKTAREIVESSWESADEITNELIIALNGKKANHLSFIELRQPRSFNADDVNEGLMERIYNIAKGTTTTFDARTSQVESLLRAAFPPIRGDRIIQIGMSIWRDGKPESKSIFTLGGCDKVLPADDGVPVKTYSVPKQDDAGERQMIIDWLTAVEKLNPDILIGYNVFGFDEKYLWDRAEELGITEEIRALSRLTDGRAKLKEQRLSSAAMGDNFFHIIDMPGRLQIDLLPYVRRTFSLQSYSLDSVSAHFMAGSIKDEPIETGNNELTIRSAKSVSGLRVGSYVILLDDEGDKISDKMEVLSIKDKNIMVRCSQGLSAIKENGRPRFWSMVKDDVSPQEIFRLQRGTNADRSKIAKYCLQDCDLVMDLYNKLEAFKNAQAMANVCCVPVNFIFLRGQGVKIESLVFKECAAENQIIEVLPSAAFEDPKDVADTEEEEEEEEDESYEGAIVLEPKTGIYLEDPIATLDFSSLYPSAIISENYSHDSLVWVKDYNLEGDLIGIQEGSDRYDELPGHRYIDISYDILISDPNDKRKHKAKIKSGTRIARYVQPTDGSKGTIPKILMKLLQARKTTRKLITTEADDFKKSLLDCQQNAYKITANSLYGQLGSKTSKVRRIVLAASTTAYGRKQLVYAKTVVEELYGKGRDPRCDAEYVYGDTDSVFINFKTRDTVTGRRIIGKEALPLVKALAIEAGAICTSALKPPHDFEYDKIMWPFCLLSKKRYVGNKYEDDLDAPEMTSMGIVMKRRDNAPIVKLIYGGVIDRILHHHDVIGAFHFVQKACRDLVGGKYGIQKLTITKSLRAEYKDPTRIAHKVLADRIAMRDPGNKPTTSERIPYVFVAQPSGAPPPRLQGERIETPSYIKANSLMPDYAYYIERQVSKPVAQVFALVLATLPGYKPSMQRDIELAKDPVKKSQKYAEKLLFDDLLMEIEKTKQKIELDKARTDKKGMFKFFQPVTKK